MASGYPPPPPPPSAPPMAPAGAAKDRSRSRSPPVGNPGAGITNFLAQQGEVPNADGFLASLAEYDSQKQPIKPNVAAHFKSLRHDIQDQIIQRGMPGVVKSTS